MRPLELQLEGFTSFREAQTLDFGPLDLFAITGATGAGKSSLLDAMTFALYGTTLRTGRQYAELVSQNASRSVVTLRFLVRGVEYRVTRSWRRRDKAPPVTNVLLDRLGDEGWQTLETKSSSVQAIIERIVGMDYDTFTRVIVLPQGKFDEFLKGDATRRHELLRQLAGHDVYERMKGRAFQQLGEFRAKREALETQLGLLELATAEERETKANEASELAREVPVREQAAHVAMEALAAEEHLFQALGRLAAARHDLAGIQGASVAMQAMRDRLENAQLADRLAGDRARVEGGRTRARAAALAQAAAGVRLAAAEGELAREQTAWEAVQAEVATREPELQARERELAAARAFEQQRQEAAADVAACVLQGKQRGEQKSQAEAALAAAEAAIAAGNERLAIARAELAAHAPGGPRLALLEALAPTLAEWVPLERRTAEERERGERVAKEAREAEEAQALAGEAFARGQADWQAAGAALAAARAAKEAAERHDHAAALRARLAPGDPCPVCEATYPGSEGLAPLPRSGAPALAPLEEAERAAERGMQGAQRALLQAEARVTALKGQIQEVQQALVDAEAAAGTLAATIAERLGSDRWDVAALRAEFARLRDGEGRHQAAAKACQEAEAQVREAVQAAAFREEALGTVLVAYQESRADYARRQALLARLDEQLAALTGGRPFDELAQALEGDRQALAGRTATAQTARQAALAGQLQAAEAATLADGERATADASLLVLEAAWADALVGVGMSEGDFERARATAADQARWRQTVEAHATQLAELGARVLTLAQEVGDRQTDAEAIATRKQAVQAAREALGQARQALAGLTAWLDADQERRRSAEAFAGQLEGVLAGEQTYDTLYKNLGTREFQGYLLEHLQAELVERATVILHELTESRFTLTLANNEFCVEDNWNGGEVRKVRTLSGGETFATSLAMALALSEKLAMGAELGSLFLDEGFGTLDTETLESVTQILESLRAQNRLIGVITHVRALGERLPMQIKVIKSPQGSRIEVEAF